MDPTECLTQVRMLAGVIGEAIEAAEPEDLALGEDDGADLLQQVIDLVDRVQALDEWVTHGGHLPAQWPTPAGLAPIPF